MRRNARSTLQFWRRDLPALALDPKRAHPRAGLVFQYTGEIDNRAASVTRVLPASARAFLIGGEKCEIHVFELLGANPLDEADLVAHGFQLPQRLIVVEQADIGRREVALVQHLRHFLALERSRAHNRSPVEFRARRRALRSGSGSCRLAHDACDASLYEGGGGPERRRKIHCTRQNTPETI